MYYKTCPYCGANLDPGEHCDCENIERTFSITIKKERFEKATTPSKRS